MSIADRGWTVVIVSNENEAHHAPDLVLRSEGLGISVTRGADPGRRGLREVPTDNMSDPDTDIRTTFARWSVRASR